MENRLELNKKPIYELPDEVLIGAYEYRKLPRKTIIPSFEPSVCLNVWGNIGSIEEKYRTKNQIWIKTSNNKLINFIKEFDFNSYRSSFTTPVLTVNEAKKIILEEFYGVKYGK